MLAPADGVDPPRRHTSHDVALALTRHIIELLTDRGDGSRYRVANIRVGAPGTPTENQLTGAAVCNLPVDGHGKLDDLLALVQAALVPADERDKEQSLALEKNMWLLMGPLDTYRQGEVAIAHDWVASLMLFPLAYWPHETRVHEDSDIVDETGALYNGVAFEVTLHRVRIADMRRLSQQVRLQLHLDDDGDLVCARYTREFNGGAKPTVTGGSSQIAAPQTLGVDSGGAAPPAGGEAPVPFAADGDGAQDVVEEP